MRQRTLLFQLIRCLILIILIATSQALVAQESGKDSEPKSIADLRSVERDERTLKEFPTIEVKPDGTTTLVFETIVPTAEVRVFVGSLNPEAIVESPLFQIVLREPLSEPATNHHLSFNLKRIETEAERAGNSPPHEKDVYYRLEIFDPRIGGCKYYQSRFHYFAEKGIYEKRITILYGPFINQILGDSAIVSWTTDSPSRGVVELSNGSSKAAPRSFLEKPNPSTNHSIKITGLSAGQVYRYRVLVFATSRQSPVNASSVYSFRAAPTRPQKFSFAYLSDGRASLGGGLSNFTGINAEVTPPLLVAAMREGANFIIFGGDMTSGFTSSVEQFDMRLNTWKALAEPVWHQIPIYVGPGNHESLADFFRDSSGNLYHRDGEGDLSSESQFARRFVTPDSDFPAPEVRDGVTGPSYRGTVYSFDYANSHFIMLNTDYWFSGGGPSDDRDLGLRLLGGNRNGYIMKNQMEWLAKDLASARKRGVQHIFICGHDDAFPTSDHAADAMWWNGMNDRSRPSGDVVAMRDRFMKLVNDFKVTALLSGHDHVYSRVVIDHSVDKVMDHPVTQFISGGAGAPLYRRNNKVPWNSAVRKFAAVYHYVIFTVTGQNISFETIDLNGNVIDHGTLP